MTKKRVLVVLLVLIIGIILGPKPDYEKENQFNKDNGVLVIAHAGGKGNYPGNTFLAFSKSVELGVDVLEMDVHLTKDHILVLRHGENETGNIRKMSNCDTVIWEETYQYLYETCNFGYNFEIDGEYPYRDLTHEEWVDAFVYLTTLEELFIEFGDTIRYNIEIKADADAPRTETADELIHLIREYELEDVVLVVTSYHDISTYIASNYEDILLATSHDEAQTFIMYAYSLTSTFYDPKGYSVLQLPTSFTLPVIDDLDLATRLLISTAHRHNMAVHYWTINDEETMRMLIELGADGIITDYPELLLEVLEEYE